MNGTKCKRIYSHLYAKENINVVQYFQKTFKNSLNVFHSQNN